MLNCIQQMTTGHVLPWRTFKPFYIQNKQVHIMNMAALLLVSDGCYALDDAIMDEQLCE